MRCFVLAAAAAISILSAASAARADAGIPCDAFSKNADGSWDVLQTTYIEGPNVKVQRDGVVTPGRIILGYDIAAMIAKACPNAQVGPPPGQAPASLPAVSAQANLAKYADANGNLDVRTITCGHLVDTSPDEAQLLLGWYSGWYNATAKKKGINLPRVRYNSRSVMDYCKTNRDKRLSDVMDLMLK